MSSSCSLCSHAAEAPLAVDESLEICVTCAARLGQLLIEQPLSLVGVWPQLGEEDDEEPEPRIRRADGTSIELREHTAELKRDLSLDDRLKLAEMLAALGLDREHLIECGFVLTGEPDPELARRALDLLFSEPAARRSLDQLRAALYPC